MAAFTEAEKSDRKPKKLTAAEAQELFQRKFTAYMEERMLNITQQIRAVCIAAGISAEDFWKGFINDKAQDDFYIHLHAQEDLHNIAANELQAKNETSTEKLGVEQPEGTPGNSTQTSTSDGHNSIPKISKP